MPGDDDDEHDDFDLHEFESDGDGAAHDPDHSGLELGDAQAQEIRQIFMTTLPQYLEPLEELLEQALAGPEADATVISTLGTTVSSILAAAQRIGVNDVAASLIEMEALIGELALSDPAEVADALRGTLLEIKRQSGASEARSEKSETIVHALGEVEGFDTSILEGLTAAGLVTVAQLQMARKHEIVAVTGLPEASIDALLAALGIEERARRSAPPARARDEELERHLRALVESEDALGQARSEVQRARTRLEALRSDLERAESLSGPRARVAEAVARVGRSLEARARAQETLAGLERERADIEERVRAARRRLSRLGDKRAQMEREQDELQEHLTMLGDRVRMLLATAEEI